MSTNSTQEAPQRKISLLTAVMIVVANMIGTGVYLSLHFQVKYNFAGDLAGFLPIMTVWILGGILSFCGAVSYAELSAMMPRNGGEYHLLSKSYHPVMGFLSGWISVTVGFTAPIGIAAVAMGKYFQGVAEWDGWAPKHFAIIAVLLITAVHWFGLKVVSRFQVFFTVGKVLLILILIASGFIWGESQDYPSVPKAAASALVGPIAIALFWVMLSYSGWNAAVYIASEIKNPAKNVPLAMFIGTGAVTILYVLLNYIFLRVTPAEELASSEEIGLIAAQHIFGEGGGNWMGIFIGFGLISTISSMVWAGPRVTSTIGEDYQIFKSVATPNKFGVPAMALLLQSTVVVLLIWLVNLKALGDFVAILLTISSTLAVFAVFLLRWREPHADRPYKTWGYPVTPAIFLLFSLYMIYKFVGTEWKVTLWAVFTLAAGYAVYRVAARSNRGEEKPFDW